VQAWRSHVGDLGDGPSEWLLWQTLVGAWPLDEDRLTGYLVKAAREAKLRTSWTRRDAAFEQSVVGYVQRVLADDAVRSGVAAVVERLHPGFVANSLGQRLLQLVLPGVPDVYQGCESVSLRLVDPDNRVAPEPAELAEVLDRGLARVPDPTTDVAAAKARLTALGMCIRRDHPGWFDASGSYTPVEARGPAQEHAVASMRGDAVLGVATRFALRLAADGGWRGTTVAVPVGLWTDVLTGRSHPVAPTADGVEAADLLGAWPVALLVRDGG